MYIEIGLSNGLLYWPFGTRFRLLATVAGVIAS